MTLSEKIHAVLRLVPLPLLAEASDAVFGVIAVVHQAHVDAAKDHATPPDLEAWRKVVAEAAADAAAPWKRIRDRAKAQGPASAAELGVHAGNAGD